MALISCPDCKHQVSDQAPTCPNCGRAIKKAEAGSQEGCFLQTMNAGCFFIFLIFLILIIGTIIR